MRRRTTLISSEFRPNHQNLLVHVKIFSYPQKSLSITSFQSFFLLFQSLDSSNKFSSNVSETLSISDLNFETSESLCIFQPRDIELSVITTNADFESMRDLFIER